LSLNEIKKSGKSLESLLKKENLEGLENVEKICEVVPELKMMSNKPMFFNIAQQNLKFPDFTNKI
jgi:hypothetical protein